MKTYKMVGSKIRPQVVKAMSALEAFKMVPDATAAIQIKGDKS